MIDWQIITGRSCLVTGATGLIGRALCNVLCEHGVNVVAAVRNIDKAKALLPSNVMCLSSDLLTPIKYEGSVDYIIHAAGNTSSKAFVEQPYEVILETVNGIIHIVDLASEKKVRGAVFLSTMEVYGLTNSENVTESDFSLLNSMIPRNCYPEAKRLAECACVSATKEYGLPIMVARLTQTFGNGVSIADNRVFAQFARAIIEGKDIILRSNGNTSRCYCDVDDAVDAILTILLKGKPGEAYNVANPGTFCTIKEMAELVSKEFSNGFSKVIIDSVDADKLGYLPEFKMKLNVDKLRSLGWEPKFGLRDMYKHLFDTFKMSEQA